MKRPSASTLWIAAAGVVAVALSLEALRTVIAGGGKATDAPAVHPARTPIPEMEMGFRARQVADSSWPEAVRLDIIFGRVRPGFTVDQMRVAKSTGGNRLGEPDRRLPDVKAEGGRAEAWIYGDQAFIVARDRVVEVQDARRVVVE